jgi:hypothetical protein
MTRAPGPQSVLSAGAAGRVFVASVVVVSAIDLSRDKREIEAGAGPCLGKKFSQ